MINLNPFKQAFILSLITFLIACNTEELEQKIAQLEAEKVETNDNLTGKEALIIDFVASMNEIQANLSEIKERENLITARFDDGNEVIKGSAKDAIIGDIELINKLLLENKEKMNALQHKYRKSTEASNLKIKELETMLNNMIKQIELKDGEIANLQNQLAEANKQLAVLFTEYNNRLEELGAKEDKLNTAYYCYGTSKELKEQGVITNQGGFIGIGKTTQLSDNFNKTYFTKIDISLETELELLGKKVNVITNHPSKSYTIEGEDEAKKLIIHDVEEFWSASKYLVIQVQ